MQYNSYCSWTYCCPSRSLLHCLSFHYNIMCSVLFSCVSVSCSFLLAYYLCLFVYYGAITNTGASTVISVASIVLTFQSTCFTRTNCWLILTLSLVTCSNVFIVQLSYLTEHCTAPASRLLILHCVNASFICSNHPT